MKLSIPRAELHRGLSRIQAIVEKRNSMPILANALLRATKGDTNQLEIAATDLEVGVRGFHTADVSKAGSLTVSARKLFEIVRELPEEPIQLAATANSYLEIHCGRSRFTLAGTAAEEFPTLPEFSPAALVRLPAAVVSSLIERTMYASSLDETRYNLNGVYFELVDEGAKIRMVATDGHRLAMVDRVLAGGGTDLASGVILPRKGLAELKRLVDEEDADEIELGIEGNSALARKGEVALTMRLIEGEFPNYRQVLPKVITRKVTIASDVLSQALATRRAALGRTQQGRSRRAERRTPSPLCEQPRSRRSQRRDRHRLPGRNAHRRLQRALPARQPRSLQDEGSRARSRGRIVTRRTPPDRGRGDPGGRDAHATLSPRHNSRKHRSVAFTQSPRSTRFRAGFPMLVAPLTTRDRRDRPDSTSSGDSPPKRATAYPTVAQ